MSKVPSLARPGAWLCLLGTVLAFVAFFLPAWGSSPTGFQLRSLWDMQVVLLWRAPSPNAGSVIVGLSFLLLLALLASLVVLAFLAVCSGKLIRWYGGLAFQTLLYVIVAGTFDFVASIFIVAMGDASGPDVLELVHIGVWLLPAGLIMTLVGCHLLWGRERKAGD